MKRLVALLLTLVLVFGLFGCGGGGETTQAPAETELGPEVVTKKDYSMWAGIVNDPKTWYDELMALPIANADMSTDELRQLCVDAFKVNLSFTWTPNEDIAYTYELLDRYSDVALPTGIAYSGLFYATGVTNNARGNVYKALNYYDPETGVMDIEAMGGIENVISNLSSACSAGAQQAWNRVSNSHGLKGMSTYSKENSNVVPVGPYTYEPYTYNYKFGSRTASNEVIAANGEEVMYESLALMLPADGLYSSSSWHVMMCSEAPKVVRDAKGKIDPYMSTMLICEQGAAGTNRDSYNQPQPNGVDVRILGTIDREVTFYDLITKGYIPFTIKELIGEDPVEPGEVWLGLDGQPAEKKDLTLAELDTYNACANYNILTMQIQVKSPDGTELVSYAPMVNSTYQGGFEYPMEGLLDVERIAPYANGKNTLHIYVRISTGALLEAYSGLVCVE